MNIVELRNVIMPIRMITGWAAEWCCLEASVDSSGRIVEFNDSEDIVWFRHLHQHWHIDAGFYHGANNGKGMFIVHFLVGDLEKLHKVGISWDKAIVTSFQTEDPLCMIECIENWMMHPPVSHAK